MTDINTSSGESDERAPQDYAIEHAEYMAKSAERLIDAVNDLAIAESEVEEGTANASDVDAARDTLGEARTSLRDSIYEFRKRRDRAALATQPAAPAEVVAQEMVSLADHNRLTLTYLPYGSTRIPVKAFDMARAVYGTTSEDDDKRVYRTLQAAFTAALASPAQAPAAPAEVVARTCSDERMCINCFANQGACLGPYHPATSRGPSDDPQPCDCRLDTSDAVMLDWLKTHTNVAKAWTGDYTPPFTVYWGDKQIRHAIRLAMYEEHARSGAALASSAQAPAAPSVGEPETAICEGCKGSGTVEDWVANENDRSGQSNYTHTIECPECGGCGLATPPAAPAAPGNEVELVKWEGGTIPPGKDWSFDSKNGFRVFRPNTPAATEAPRFQRWKLSDKFRSMQRNDEGHFYAKDEVDAYFAAPTTAAAVGASVPEHYDEVKATLQGLHALMVTLSGMAQKVGPLYSQGIQFTHKITAALRHLDALAAVGASVQPVPESLSDALRLIVEALEQSTPNAAHYPEPRERHAAALKAARAALATTNTAAPGAPAAFIQHAFSQEEGLLEDLVFDKDEELEGSLYDYTPLYRIDSLRLPDHDTAAIVKALRGKTVTISRTPYEDLDKAIAWVMGVGVGQALAAPGAPGQEAAAVQAVDAKDAARYRFLRKRSYRRTVNCSDGVVGVKFEAKQHDEWDANQDAEADLDCAIDAALPPSGAGEKTS